MENKDKMNLSNEENQDLNKQEKNSQNQSDNNEQTRVSNEQKNEINGEVLNPPEIENELEKKGEEELNEMEKLQNEINQMKEEANKWKDKFLRKMAEFDNYKKRVEQDQLQLIKYANEKLIKDLLPIIDDFERSLTFSKDELKNNSILQGVEMVYNKFMKVLSDYGLKKIEALNQPFDFNYHEALLQVPKDGVDPLTVIEEVEKGYLLNDKVIRHSKVIVSSEMNIETKPSDNEDKNNGEVK